MFRKWIILPFLFLVLPVLVILYQRSGHDEYEFTCPPETVLASEKNSAAWHHKSPLKKRRGVALVVHGLNLKPARMGSIIQELNRAGIDVLNVSLHGHGDNYVPRDGRGPKEARLDSFRACTYDLWSSEVRKAYGKVRERGEQRKVPVFLVGYSLGGLLGCDLMAADPGVHFDRMVLFAPALNAVIEPYILKVLLPFPDIVIDSLSPESYRSNDGTPMAGYKALFRALDHFQGCTKAGLNVPTLVFMDREDEFISHDKLEEMVLNDRLDRWKIVTVRKDPPAAGLYAHHLLIDETVMGEQAWKRMGEAVLMHLLPGTQRPGTVRPSAR